MNKSDKHHNLSNTLIYIVNEKLTVKRADKNRKEKKPRRRMTQKAEEPRNKRNPEEG